MGRAPCCDKANVKKGPWSPEEDAKLKAYIEEHGTGGNWIALPQKIGLKRCGKSCRLRWLNYLRPNIKHGGFSEEEDQIICSLYISIGSRWSIIAAQLPGRTDNDIKNYWNTRLKKKLLGKRRESLHSCRVSPDQGLAEVANGMNSESPSQAQLSASAIERMQLHMQLNGLYNPFSFYTHPALWPKYHPLGGSSLQSQATDAIIATPTQQTPDSTSTESSEQVMLTTKLDMHDSMSATAPKAFELSGLGFSSSSSNGLLGMEQPTSSFGSEAAELQGLLYSKNVSLGEQDDHHQLGELDCFKEMDDEKVSMNWWSTDVFEEKSLSSSWDSVSAAHPDAMFQDFMLPFDL